MLSSLTFSPSTPTGTKPLYSNKEQKETHTLKLILGSSSFQQGQVAHDVLQVDHVRGARVGGGSSGRGDGTFIHFQT